MFYRYVFRFSNLISQKQEIQQRLQSIKTATGDIMSQGQVENINVDQSGKVVIELKLDQDYRKIKHLCQESLKDVEWIKNLEIKMAPKPVSSEKVFKKGNLQNVKKILAVSSCKGGVGKSTVAVNLTFSLHKLGYKVGIFDADIYGPSLPTLIGKEKHKLEAPEDRPKEIIPIEFEGVKTMSFGFANTKAVMRGPMVSSIVTSLIYSTIWNDLDYLIVDMPPGTGDISLTLCQEIKFDGAVIVTTPQKLSFIDVVKGIEMFDQLKVPTLSVVENMAEYVCPNCNHHHKPFGPGYQNMLKKQFGIKNSISIPLYGDISKYSDLGSPVVMTLPDNHTINKLYSTLALGVVEELNQAVLEPPHVRYETGTKLVIVRQQDGKEKKISAHYLRQKCHCALCIDEFTGKKLINEQSVDESVYPHKIESKGNYAVAIIWSDGHKSSIYPYERLLSHEIKEYK